MIDFSVLKCPVCSSPMIQNEKSCFCTGLKKHNFDFSSSGYLNFNVKNAKGDNKDQMQSRRFFLESEAYLPLRNEISSILRSNHPRTLLDAGCGEGYYTSAFSEFVSSIYGIDLSKDGIMMASKKAKRENLPICYFVGSIFELPFQNESLDVVTNIFAPCCESEFHRVLKQGGILIVVGAGEKHLLELKEVLYDTPYVNPGRNDLPVNMNLISQKRLTYSFHLEDNEHVLSLFSMTPYYWKTSLNDKDKLLQISSMDCTADFDIFLYKKN